MTLIIDASVAVKWVVDEGDRADARALVKGKHELAAPDFALIEVANILWKKVRKREIDHAQATSGLAGVRATYSRLVPTGPILGRAMDLSLQLDHPVYRLHVSGSGRTRRLSAGDR